MSYEIRVKYIDERLEKCPIIEETLYRNLNKEKAIENKRRLAMVLYYWITEWSVDDIEDYIEKDFLEFEDWEMYNISGVKLIKDDGSTELVDLRKFYPNDRRIGDVTPMIIKSVELLEKI